MAGKKKEDLPEGKTKARVLVDCRFGKVNDVVEITAEEAAEAAGQVDPHPDAVAYAESLKG
jgi:hypothetical protein